ncbi:MAG: hypothetical protein HY673_19425 [Chloroflexi bacterium]|nr:hypothetical protein [Chloroflexota bacterium]
MVQSVIWPAAQAGPGHPFSACKETTTDWIDIAAHFFSRPLTVFILVLAAACAATIVVGAVRMWKASLKSPRVAPKRSFISLCDGDLVWSEDTGLARKGSGFLRVASPVAMVYALVASVVYVFAIPFLGFYTVGGLLARKIGKVLSFPEGKEVEK